VLSGRQDRIRPAASLQRGVANKGSRRRRKFPGGGLALEPASSKSTAGRACSVPLPAACKAARCRDARLCGQAHGRAFNRKATIADCCDSLTASRCGPLLPVPDDNYAHSFRHRHLSVAFKDPIVTQKRNGSTGRAPSDGAKSSTEARAQQTLLKANALQDAILTSATFSIIATDEKGIIQLFNAGAERMLGYRAAEVVNKISPSDIHDPEEVRARAEALSIELATPIAPGFEALVFKASRGMEDIYELTYIGKDGSRFPALISITALRDDLEDIIGYLLIGTDNSARKQVEVALHDAMAAANTANLAKSEFLSSMSHELRTPLNAILGFAQLIESGAPAPTPSQRRSVDQILQAGWHLLKLINEILDLTLIESGKLSLSLEPISLAEVMAECQAMVGPLALSRNVKVAFPQAVSPHYILADRTRVKQVLINLLSNAIKYNKSCGSVSVEYTVTGAGRMRISVKDTGDGLTTEQLTHLFEPFNRMGREASGEEGTGIGLVVCKRLMESMKGLIGADSISGQGSIFWIEIGLTSKPRIAITEVVGVPLSTAQAAPEPQLRTVLYIEDNPANLMLVEDLISRRPDILLRSAMDAISGIEIARAVLPDLILMDINLPGISGTSAMKILAKDPATRSIPVIALSANAMPRDIARGLDAGFFRYLTKPIVVSEFMTALDSALRSRTAKPDNSKAETIA
jgi:PAS domain S-box-containing protein